MTITARIAYPMTTRGHKNSIDLNSFDQKLPKDTAVQAAERVAVRQMLIDTGNTDLLAMLGLDEVVGA